MRPRKNWTVRLIMFTTLSLIAGGCSNGAANEGKTEEANKNAEPVELVFYSVSKDSEENFNERFGNAIRKKFPNYTIKYIQRVPNSTDLQQLLTSGAQIDIQWDSIASFTGSVLDSGTAFDMTDLIKQHNLDLNRFEPSMIDSLKKMSGGGLYGLPLYNDRMALYYNKDLFDKFGVPYPKDGMTWDEIIELSNQMTREESGVVYTGFSPSLNQVFVSNPYSLPLVDSSTNKATINNDTWKKIIDTMLIRPTQNNMYKKKIEQSNGKIPDSNTFVKEKTLAMYTASPLLPVVFAQDMSSMNWDVVTFPAFKDLPGVGAQAYPGVISVTKMSKNKDAAMEVIKYLTSDEYQLESSKNGIMTVLKDKAIQKTLGQNTAYKDKNFSAFFTKFPAMAEKTVSESKAAVLGKYTTNAMKVVNEEMDINTMLRTTEEEANKALQSASAK
ncbi:ABC transporter substrate-binding protein [Paenibacillus sp. OAS669]|uniref:ABC transporter substrate-binding protein n=1 Tax=Paenibacillus sp. OAS669 TaxID=2663821 RepID=UPI001789707E|nr:extracellular solute-binding protein [Paenibacillus sp. OAS669]MBE1440637.1 multiple sugar transport system substrate-binding protein [Paenibacillus sp. OAS669]